MIINQIAVGGGGGGIVINPNHIFVDIPARDVYFDLHPEELTEGLFISVGTLFQQWTGIEWLDKTAIIVGPPGPPGVQLVPLDRMYVPAGDNLGYDDEFSNGEIDASWVPVDTPGFANTWYEPLGTKGLSGYLPSGRGAFKLSGILKPFAGLDPPYYIETALRIYSRSQNYPGAGLILSEGTSVGSGAQIVGLYITDAGCNLSRWTGFNARSHNNEVSQEPNAVISQVHIRLVCEGANSFRVLHSIDGIVWLDFLGKAFTLACSPTHFGLCASTHNNSSYPFSVHFGYFRVRSGLPING